MAGMITVEKVTENNAEAVNSGLQANLKSTNSQKVLDKCPRPTKLKQKCANLVMPVINKDIWAKQS